MKKIEVLSTKTSLRWMIQNSEMRFSIYNSSMNQSIKHIKNDSFLYSKKKKNQKKIISIHHLLLIFRYMAETTPQVFETFEAKPETKQFNLTATFETYAKNK
jgi:hypothetical protein